mgnify:CR=1 FL=1
MLRHRSTPVDHRADHPANWHYAGPAVFLHWAIALLVVIQVGLGMYMMAIEEQPGSGWYFALHVSFGLTVAVLIALRIVWRLGHKPAPLPASAAPVSRDASLHLVPVVRRRSTLRRPPASGCATTCAACWSRWHSCRCSSHSSGVPTTRSLERCR